MRAHRIAGTVVASAIACGAGCGGAPKRATPIAIALQPDVAEETWYRATSICGQGPYELEIPVESARWGEELEVRLSTPRRVALHAVIVADDAEVVKEASVYGEHGRVDGTPENTRCIAGVRERLVARGGGGSGGGGAAPPGPPGPPGVPVQPGVSVRVGDPPPPPAAPQLEIERGPAPPSISLVRHGWRVRERGGAIGQRFGRIRIRLWSIQPNDLDGVRFGVRHIVWRPNVPDAEYEAHLARIAAEDAAAVKRAEERWRQEQRRRPPEAPPPVEDPAAARERARKEEEARRRREAELAEQEAARRRREQFCASHPEDRGCWGVGGRREHLRMEQLLRDRERYCADHAEDARCWSAPERARREAAWNQRVRIAERGPAPPDGPPPAALAEVVPPKLSKHAEWRPGYWQWTGATWTWLGGMWRVPDRDIAEEQTTIAPEPPPTLKVEPVPPPPMATTIWVAGFWQWNGTVWVWVPGSYQARPEAGASWRPAEWKARGAKHILIPGAWVRVRVKGR